MPSRPWRLAAAWLCFLGPFFYLTYGLSNWYASSLAHVPSVAFDWEARVPFVAWTIIPYWTENLFYAGSLFLARTRREVHTLGRRLLTAQLVAVACFVLFPLKFSFSHPAVTDGLAGHLFTALSGFDKPFNEAPSLHVALAVILCQHYLRHAPRWLRLPLLGWFVLIALSILTTYQHHFVDLPTGALLGAFCLWLWPDDADSPLTTWQLTRDARRRTLALRYLTGTAFLVLLAAGVRSWAWWCLWPATSLALVALCYLGFGAVGFQKRTDGRMSVAAHMLLLPYLSGAWINSRLWTWRLPKAVTIAEGIFIGRLPSAGDGRAYATVVDLCAELPAPGGNHRCLPMLDLVAPAPSELGAAARMIEAARQQGPVLVCCALGYSRSAAAVCSWMLHTGRAGDAAEAAASLAQRRPIVLSATHLDHIALAQEPTQ